MGNIFRRAKPEMVCKHKNEENNHGNRLPNDVTVDILTRLDLLSLARCTATSPNLLHDLLPQVPSLRTGPLPETVFRTGPLPARYLQRFLRNVCYDKFVWPLMCRTMSPDTPKFIRDWIFWVGTRFLGRITKFDGRLTDMAARFLHRFKGLNYLEVEIPISNTFRSCWYTWAHSNEVTKAYSLFIVGKSDFFRAYDLYLRHSYELSVSCNTFFGFLGEDKRGTVVIRNARGSATICSEKCTRWINRRTISIYVPTLTVRSRKKKNKKKTMRHVWLFFMYADVPLLGEDGGGSVETIKSRLFGSKGPFDCKDAEEVKDVVTRILSHPEMWDTTDTWE